MNDKEILQQLKKAFLSIEDIIDNQEEQITEENYYELKEAMGQLSKVYSDTYEAIKNKDDISLYYEENILISDIIECDNMIVTNNDNEYICYDDTENGTKWWEDQEFINNF